MAIAFDNSTTSAVLNTNPGTFSHTTSGSNRILFVHVTGDSAGDNVSGVTYAGVTMTLVAKLTNSPQTFGDRWRYLFVLVNPAVGANTVSIADSGFANAFLAIAASYTGAAQTGQPDASATNTTVSNSTTFASSITSIADNCWSFCAISQNGGAVLTAGTGTTLRGTQAATGDIVSDSNGVIHPAGSYTMNYTSGSSNHWGSFIATISPATATVTHLLSSTGAGS